ncbi:MAG: nucleotidyltransferase domain-containing protein [Methylobacter sp.]|nr:nucleotidyltransferase domain-containing protein [Methylobacter sp.]
MRLTFSQAQITKSTVDRILGTSCKVWLFGSRVDDNARGGDIDLMIETEVSLQIALTSFVNCMVP